MSTFSARRKDYSSALLDLVSQDGSIMLQDATVNQEIKKVYPTIQSKQSIPSNLLSGSSYLDFELNSSQNQISLLRGIKLKLNVTNTSASAITVVSPYFWLDYATILANGVEVPNCRVPAAAMFWLINATYSSDQAYALGVDGGWIANPYLGTYLQPTAAMSPGATPEYLLNIPTFLDQTQVPLHSNIIYTLRLQFNGGTRLRIAGPGNVSEITTQNVEVLLDGIVCSGRLKEALDAKLLSAPYLARALTHGAYKQLSVGSMSAGAQYDQLLSLQGKFAGMFINVYDDSVATADKLQYTFEQLNRLDIIDQTGQSVLLFDSGDNNDTLLRNQIPADQWTNPRPFNTLYVYPVSFSDQPMANFFDNSSHGNVRFMNIERLRIVPTTAVTSGVINVIPWQETEIKIDYRSKKVTSNTDC